MVILSNNKRRLKLMGRNGDNRNICFITEHNYKSEIIKNETHKELFNINGKNIVCDKIERIILYCTKCGHIIQNNLK
jgi:hypothetical protein